MRNKRAIDSLFPRTRQAILAAALLHPDREWYLSDLAQHLGVRPSSLQRELASLTSAEVLTRREDGNRVYFHANPDCPFLPELQGLLIKTVGVTDILRETLTPFAKRIAWAFIYGSVARAEERATSDVDLMIIGTVGLADLTPALRRAEKHLSRAVNPTLYSRDEFATKLRAKDHFLTSVLDEAVLFILGDRHELSAVTSQSSRAGPRHQPSRT
jgi:DNA-binding transcriptional ArsR family regulator